MANNQAILDTRKVVSGKDGRVFVNVNGVDIFLAEADTFTLQANVTNADYQPVGSFTAFGVPVSVSYTLTIAEVTVRDDVVMAPILDAFKKGTYPVFDFQGAIDRQYDGQEERILISNCIPDGTLDIMNFTPGELLKRNLTFRVNSVPDMIKQLLND